MFALLNFAISLIAVAIVMVFFQVVPTFNILLLPVLLAYLFMFSLGLGLLLAALSVFFRDIMHLWGVILTAWTYATPLFYSIEILPDWMVSVMQFNPMYYYVTYFREIAMWGTTPGLTENQMCIRDRVFYSIMLILSRPKQENALKARMTGRDHHRLSSSRPR